MRDFCQGEIAHYEIPHHLKLTTEFPMAVIGKVRKVEMRAVSIAEQGLEAVAGVRNA